MRFVATALLETAGFGLVVVGLWRISPSVALIAAGFGLIAAGFGLSEGRS